METPPHTRSFDADGPLPKSPITAYGQQYKASGSATLPAERIGAPPTPPKSGSRPSSGSFQPIRPPTPDATQPPTPVRTKDAAPIDFPMPPKGPPVPKHKQAASMSVTQTKTGPPLRVAIPPKADSNFFTALAAQERKVLELKEELHKAEAELTRLKGQWASTEAHKRRTEGEQHIHKMRPLSAAAVKAPWKSDDDDGSSAWMYQEMERRKTLIGNAKTSHRRVFQGSRKPRALSLLTPENLPNQAQPGTAPPENIESRGPRDRNSSPVHAYTSPELAEHFSEDRLPTASSSSSNPRYAGKRMTADFRTGLWTFFEDLKHATLGDEVRPTLVLESQSEERPQTGPSALIREERKTPSRPSPARPSKRSSRKRETMQSHDDSQAGEFSRAFWKDHGFVESRRNSRTSSPRTKAERTTPRLHTRYYSVDDWEAWDSPTSDRSSPIKSGTATSQSKVPPSPSPLTQSSDNDSERSNDVTPRQSILPTRSQEHTDSIPWPALNKFDASHLRRTATSLMDDWERSLSAEGSDRIAHFTT